MSSLRPFDRRTFLARSAFVGCSLAASPLLTGISLASAPWDTRLVVIILRGGMDGLAVVRPYGDPDYRDVRGAIDGKNARQLYDLDGFYALHPELGALMPLWNRGELGFVHAVSTPYRDKRSHFDGQDLLEAGTPNLAGVRDGWLNRMLGQLPGVKARTALAIGHGEMKVLDGSVPVSDWAPDADLAISPQAMQLAELMMQDDAMFHAALSEAAMLSEVDGMRVKGKAHEKVARFAAEHLRTDTRVVSFSINGWDTHRYQTRTMKGALSRLSETILTLQAELGTEVWGKTAVVAMTEFGRTVRLNGTAGTDHGTGGVMLLAGGAVRGKRVLGDWPGLDEASLYERRDLMPTGDVRAPVAWLMRGLTGLSRTTLEQTVFPGLDMSVDHGYLR